MKYWPLSPLMLSTPVSEVTALQSDVANVSLVEPAGMLYVTDESLFPRPSVGILLCGEQKTSVSVPFQTLSDV